jgi:polyisoprenoid-binding protein YceI
LKILILFLVLFLSSSLLAQDKNYQVSSNSKIEFVAIGNPSMLTINGTGQGLSGNIFIQKDGMMTGNIEMDLNTLDSGLELRTKHMKNKYLEVDKSDFSKARFKITKANSNQNPIVYEGTLLLHGIEKPLNGTGEFKKSEDGLTLTSDFKVNLEDHGIALPNYAGITIEKQVSIKLTLNSSLSK